MKSSPCLSAWSCVLLLVLCVIARPSLVQGRDLLTVVSPDLSQYFPLNQIYERPSLFGLPPYLDVLTGNAVYTATPDNPFGCNQIPPFFTPDPDQPPQGQPTIIALIDRGNCTFATKARNAQNAGASAFLILNNDAQYGTNIPYMAATAAEAATVAIPGMIIRGSDAAILKNAINTTFTGVTLTMSYFLPNPDDRVEIDFFTYAGDTSSLTFKRQFKDIISSFGSHVLFEPHYQILIGGYGFTCVINGASCTQSALDARCGNQCTNCGQYCQVDPDLNRTRGASGTDVILEGLRAKCVWLYGNSTSPYNNIVWFDYVLGHDAACAGAPHNYDATCANKLITSLGVPSDFMSWCMQTPSMVNYTSPVKYSVLENDLGWQNSFGRIPPPLLLVNNEIYFGSLACPDPVGVACPPLQMICRGFADGTQPATCLTSPGCQMGLVLDACGVCGGDNATCTGCDNVVNSFKVRDACDSCLLRSDPNYHENKDDCPAQPGSGIGLGAIIGIIIAAVVLIAAAVFWYMRRQSAIMKDDIDSLLKQYLPLDGNLGPSNTDSSRTRVDPSRLIAEEPQTGL